MREKEREIKARRERNKGYKRVKSRIKRRYIKKDRGSERESVAEEKEIGEMEREREREKEKKEKQVGQKGSNTKENIYIYIYIYI